MNTAAIKRAEKAIADAGLELVEVSRSGGHYQIRGGALLVNWYPFSKKQTAYVNATQKGVQNADVQKVIQLAQSAPEIQSEKVKRNGGRAARAKRRMLKTHPFCHWCGIKLTAETATLEHIIPLKRGGLDHHNNMTLACEPHNRERGHDMPELNIHDKDQFAKAFKALDATSEPEAIRNLIDSDEDQDLMQSKAGNWYTVEDGELRQVEP